MMISMDPPAHTRVRQLVSKVFTPRRVSELEPSVRAITRARRAFEEILARFPEYEIDEDGLEWSHNNNVRGYARVPMRLQ